MALRRTGRLSIDYQLPETCLEAGKKTARGVAGIRAQVIRSADKFQYEQKTASQRGVVIARCAVKTQPEMLSSRSFYLSHIR